MSIINLVPKQPFSHRPRIWVFAKWTTDYGNSCDLWSRSLFDISQMMGHDIDLGRVELMGNSFWLMLSGKYWGFSGLVSFHFVSISLFKHFLLTIDTNIFFWLIFARFYIKQLRLPKEKSVH